MALVWVTCTFLLYAKAGLIVVPTLGVARRTELDNVREISGRTWLLGRAGLVSAIVEVKEGPGSPSASEEGRLTLGLRPGCRFSPRAERVGGVSCQGSSSDAGLFREC